jgi:hypothetical protein
MLKSGPVTLIFVKGFSEEKKGHLERDQLSLDRAFLVYSYFKAAGIEDEKLIVKVDPSIDRPSSQSSHQRLGKVVVSIY